MASREEMRRNELIAEIRTLSEEMRYLLTENRCLTREIRKLKQQKCRRLRPAGEEK